MNNSNVAYDCRNNLNNCTFTLLNYEVDEISYLNNCTFTLLNYEIDQISYLKEYQNPFNTKVREFVSCELLEKEIEYDLDTSF